MASISARTLAEWRVKLGHTLSLLSRVHDRNVQQAGIALICAKEAILESELAEIRDRHPEAIESTAEASEAVDRLCEVAWKLIKMHMEYPRPDCNDYYRAIERAIIEQFRVLDRSVAAAPTKSKPTSFELNTTCGMLGVYANQVARCFYDLDPRPIA